MLRRYDTALDLSHKRAHNVIAYRETFDARMRLVAKHTRLRHPFLEDYRGTWPAIRSEMQGLGGDSYRGEARLMGPYGFGPVPVLHPDAR